MSFKGNRRVRIIRYRSDRNDNGGKVGIITGLWAKWADVRERFGNNDATQGQDSWQYEQEIKIRYEPTRPTHSNDLIEYNDTLYKITSLRRDVEATLNFEVMRCIMSDIEINNMPPVNVDNIQVIDYTSTTEGSVTWQDDRLIGKVPFGAFMDGPGFEILTAAEWDNGDGFDSDKKQVYINSATGETYWNQVFYPKTYSFIQVY